jgi:ribose/xylose/arabinose/galactoside ABC-type transport system permease subunit
MTRRLLPLAATVLVFVLGYLYCMTQFPGFASTRVLGNLLTDNAFIGIAAVGMTFVILSGGIDLSVGSVIAFTGVFLAAAIGWWGMHPLAAFLVALILATAFGAGMGCVIHYLDMPPFIVTLAGAFLARGIGFLITTDSIPVTHELYASLNDAFIRLAGGGRLTIAAIVMLAVTVAGMVLAHFTRFGANVYALGGNRTSAELMGVPLAATTIRVYALSGLLAGVAGIVFSFYTSAGYPLAAVGVELDTIAAVVIGGTLLTGGSGTIFGTLIGTLIQGLIQTYITFEGTLSSWWTKIVVGLLLLMFILLQRGLTIVGERRATLARL